MLKRFVVVGCCGVNCRFINTHNVGKSNKKSLGIKLANFNIIVIIEGKVLSYRSLAPQFYSYHEAEMPFALMTSFSSIVVFICAFLSPRKV